MHSSQQEIIFEIIWKDHNSLKAGIFYYRFFLKKPIPV